MGLDGQITGGVGRSAYEIDPSGGVRGMAMPGPVTVEPGVDPSTIPAWFSTLGAGVSGDLTGGAQSYLPVGLGVYPGDTPAAQVQPAPVPEPASVAIFLACAVAGLYLREIGGHPLFPGIRKPAAPSATQKVAEPVPSRQWVAPSAPSAPLDT